MSVPEARKCAGGCGRDLDAINPPLRKDAKVCRQGSCRKAAQRRRQRERSNSRKPRSPGDYKSRLLTRLRPRDPYAPFVEAIAYINSYGEGGPVNPELPRHWDHDVGEAEIVRLAEFASPEPVIDHRREAA